MVKVIVRRNRTLGTFVDRVRSLFGRGNAKSYNDLVNEIAILNRALNNSRQSRRVMDDHCARMASQLEAHRNTRAMIAAQETLGANATVKRMAALARGDA